MHVSILIRRYRHLKFRRNENFKKCEFSITLVYKARIKSLPINNVGLFVGRTLNRQRYLDILYIYLDFFLIVDTSDFIDPFLLKDLSQHQLLQIVPIIGLQKSNNDVLFVVGWHGFDPIDSIINWPNIHRHQFAYGCSP